MNIYVYIHISHAHAYACTHAKMVPHNAVKQYITKSILTQKVIYTCSNASK